MLLSRSLKKKEIRILSDLTVLLEKFFQKLKKNRHGHLK